MKTLILVLAAGVALSASGYTHAQAAKQPRAASQQANPQPKLFDPNDTAILLLDHQTGLFQTVKDITLQELRTNTVVLAKLAALAKIPSSLRRRSPADPMVR